LIAAECKDTLQGLIKLIIETLELKIRDNEREEATLEMLASKQAKLIMLAKFKEAN
jgi:hypothetical protein